MRTLESKLVEDPSYWSIKEVAAGHRVVFTNGCFDMLNVGHVGYLSEARKLGDVLIIGVNDDESMLTLKGGIRPVNLMEDRMTLLAALEIVDAVTPMRSTRNVQLLKEIVPSIWTLGGHYTMDKLDPEEAATARVLGVEIRILHLHLGFATCSFPRLAYTGNATN